MPDVLHELSSQVGQRGEHATRNNVSLDLGEPEFDLVEPGGIGRGEVQVNLRMSIQKIVDLPRLMGREIVGNHVDLFSAWLVDNDVRQERHKLRRRVSHGRLAEHFACLGVERRVQGQRAVPEILKPVPLGASRREWQHRILAVQRLDRGLLIHTEHRRMRRRVQIQPNDVGGLLLKIRVVARHVAVQPLRLEAVLGPHPRHHHVTDLELRSQPARAPLRRPVRRRTLERPFQNARLQRSSQRAGLLPSVPAEQPCQPLFPKSLAPAIDKRIIAVQLVANRGPGMVCLQQQQQTRPARVIGTPAAARRSLVEFQTFRIRKYDRVLHGTQSYYRFICYRPLVSPVALFGLMHKTRLHYIGLQYSMPDNKTGGILLQGDKDNYRAILVALQGVSGVAVSVGEKDREFVPVSLRTVVTKGEEEKTAQDKGTESAPPASKPTETAPLEAAKGTVNVSANPAGADVLVDGDFVGNSPSTLKLTSGKHTVTVKMSGYADWSKDITVQSGSEVQLTANLEKQSPQLF